MQTFSLNLDSASMTNLVGKSGAMTWSLERESDSFQLACDWERSYTETMEKMHKLKVPKKSSNSDQMDSRESQEEGTGEGDGHCTLQTRKKLSETLLWAPKIDKKTRSRIQDIANEEEDDSESDGFFTLSFGIGDGADYEEEEDEEEDNDEEQDDEEAEENEYAYKEEQIIKRVLVFDE